MRSFDSPPPDQDELSVPESSPESDATRVGAAACGIREELIYDLRSGRASSDCFYADVHALSSHTVSEVDRRAADALDGYSMYVTSTLREAPRTRGEYALELLTLGMAVRLYEGVAARTPAWVVGVCRELYWMRRRWPRLKPMIDAVRAGIFQVWMRRKLQSGRYGRGGNAVFERLETKPAACWAGVPHLIAWMQSTGEFEQEARRLDNWKAFLSEFPRMQAERCIAVSVSLFDWFTDEAHGALGKYTRGVIPFLETAHTRRFWREDRLFCARERVEYHLGMVAAEVMNAGLRSEFERKPKKILLVPTCMRGAQASQCKAVVRGVDISCAACDPACAVNRISRHMRAQGVQVFMVPHASGFSRWLERWQSDPTVGVAAVACLLNILPGGYEMRARRIASQCVPLDYPGCAKHWTEEGIPTAVNEARLAQIVGESRA